MTGSLLILLVGLAEPGKAAADNTAPSSTPWNAGAAMPGAQSMGAPPAPPPPSYVWQPAPAPSSLVTSPAPAAEPVASSHLGWPFWTAVGAVVVTGMVLGYLYFRQDGDLAMPNTTFGTKQF
jgi:hypothetical protein